MRPKDKKPDLPIAELLRSPYSYPSFLAAAFDWIGADLSTIYRLFDKKDKRFLILDIIQFIGALK